MFLNKDFTLLCILRKRGRNMLTEMEKIDQIRSFSKENLIEKLEHAKYNISMIGTIAFDIPWKNLSEVLAKKFEQDSFTIHILRESETTIAQYALMNDSQGNVTDSEGLSRGNLTGIKEKSIKELKEILSKSNHGKNIEPPEDKYARDLGEIYYTEKRKYIIESYKIHGCEEEFKKFIQNHISEEILKTKSTFLVDPLFADVLGKNSNDSTNIFTRYMKKIDQELEKQINEKGYFLSNLETLLKMDSDQINGDMKVIVDKKGQKSIRLQLEVKTEDICVKKNTDFPVEQWIEDFSLEDDKAGINYRIEADKEQAIKKASEIKKNKIIEYQNNPETKQRLFIKNCYMPIPVPMIKIDNELFITMALTKFDSINKFQYTGDIVTDETTGKCKIKESKEGYISLWQNEFVNYYAEYFLNENGAQKYSTEETIKGNRKEVIDIFDENRSRIGIGPRDAFLSNMAIVKSVVWALIFDRKGRILIHQRAKNAKDNQGLWDKSVGGHVSIEDLDTIEAIKREIAEELYTKEYEGQGGHDIIQWTITNKNKIIYLGDWKTSRFPDLSALNLNRDEYYNFSLNYPDINKRDFRREIVVTERLLPNGETVKAKCFVDAYLCIVSEDFDINSLLNSNYAILTPNELKRCVIRKKIKLNKAREYDLENGVEEEFKPTSDLAYLVESAIWDDVVTEFSRKVKETFAEKEVKSYDI